jgi:hypothetical protein
MNIIYGKKNIFLNKLNPGLRKNLYKLTKLEMGKIKIETTQCEVILEKFCSVFWPL